MSEIIPFDFEEQAVRVVMRDGEPWFVAADVCRVLELGNTSEALKRLDEDEMTLISTEGQSGRGGARSLNIISESGLYALVLTSRKEAAKRFRKWITAEVLPAIRRTGSYTLPGTPEPEAETDAAMTARDWLAMIREARILGGLPAGRRIWALSPLPPLNPARLVTAGIDPAEGRACLDHLLITYDGLDTPGMAAMGLRDIEAGALFVGNASTAFSGTRWAGGAHRAVLLSLPGVAPDTSVRSLAGNAMRGLVIPAVLLAAEGYHA